MLVKMCLLGYEHKKTSTTSTKMNKHISVFSYNNNVDDDEALSGEHQCANCGKGEEEDNVHLKKCNGCKMVKYCVMLLVKKSIVPSTKRNVGNVRRNFTRKLYSNSLRPRKIVPFAKYICQRRKLERCTTHAAGKLFVRDVFTKYQK